MNNFGENLILLTKTRYPVLKGILRHLGQTLEDDFTWKNYSKM